MAWTKLDRFTIDLAPPEEEVPPPVGWVKLDTRTITLTPKEEPPLVGWVKLDTRTITLIPTEAPPVPPEYELIFHHEYPLSKTYVGKASEGTSTFTIPFPEQLFPSNWVVDKIIDTFEDKVKEQGERMLDLKIYEDATPTWKTNFMIKSVCTTSSPFPWAVVIIAILAIILVVVIKDLVTVSKDIDWGKPVEVITKTGLIILGIIGGIIGITLIAKKRKRGVKV